MKRISWFFVLAVFLVFSNSVHAQFTTMGLDGKEVKQLKLFQNRLYAGTNDGLYSLDLNSSNAHWNLLGLKNRHVTSFLILSSDSLLAGTFEREEQDSVYLYASFDGGQSWQSYQNGLGSDSTSRSIVDMDLARPTADTLYAVNKNEVYRSVDKGQSWHKQFNIGNRLTFINAAFYGTPHVFTGGQSGFGRGIAFWSDDAGSSWSGLALDDFQSFYINKVAVNPHQPDLAYAAFDNKITKSSDWSISWNTKLFVDEYSFQEVLVSHRHPDVVYAAGNNMRNGLKLYKSWDTGEDWGVIRDTTAAASRINSIDLQSRADPEKVYMGTENGVFSFDNSVDPTPVTLEPTVQIMSPSDSSQRYYQPDTNEWYKGVELRLDGRDKDGHIVEYGWAINNQSLTWTSDSSITLLPEDFDGSGSYSIRVTSRDDDSLFATPDTIRLEMVEPTLDQGILVVDGTNEKDFDRVNHLGQLTDAYIDSLYKSWITPRSVSEWDVKKQGVPTRDKLGDHPLVIWHADNWYGASSDAHKIGRHTSALADYMSMGGDFILSGWKAIKSLNPATSFPHIFERNDFTRKFLGIKQAGQSGAAPPGDMVGAHGNNTYSDLSIDSSLVSGYPVSFYDFMVDVIIIHESSETTNPLYSFRCRDECSNPKWRGQTVAQLNRETKFSAATLGFPYTFMKHQQAGQSVNHILNTLGYKATSLDKAELPDRFALKQNYPNPFNPTTTIQFNLPRASDVKLAVYDVLGHRVTTLVNGKKQAGRHSITFDASNLSSGVYIYRLQVDGYSKSRKMLLVK